MLAFSVEFSHSLGQKQTMVELRPRTNLIGLALLNRRGAVHPGSGGRRHADGTHEWRQRT